MQLIRENSFEIDDILMKASDPSHVDGVTWSLSADGTTFSATFVCERFARCTVTVALEAEGRATELQLETAARIASEELDNRLCTMGNLAVFGLDPGVEPEALPDGFALEFVYEDEEQCEGLEVPMLRAG